MSTVAEIVTAALLPVLSNTWAAELPPGPTWPALVFEVDTETEDQWCMGGGYDQHDITVTIFARTAEQVDALKPQVRTAFEALASFMYEDKGGDSPFEDDPNVYGYFMTFRLRTSRY